MPSLAELTRTLVNRLDAIHQQSGAVVTPRIGGSSHFVALQLAEALSDVHAAGSALVEAHRRAIRVFHDVDSSRQPIPANAGTRTLLSQPPELATLSVLIKAWLFFVRAFCDNAYRLLLGEEQNRPAPRGGSMESIFNPNNPVAVILATHASDLPTWFRELRHVRNEMKEGAAFAFSQLDARGLGLTIFKIHAQKNPLPQIDVVAGHTVTFADVAEDARRILEILDMLASPPGASR
jgi:hypothetical protein